MGFGLRKTGLTDSIYCQCFGATQHITMNLDIQSCFWVLIPWVPLFGS